MEQPKTDGEEIRPCLIGGFRVKNAPFIYVHPIEVDDCGRVVSVDMVRVRLKFWSAEMGTELAERASLLPSTDVGGYRSYSSQLFPGRYRVLSTYVMGDTSVTLGIGLVGSSGKVDMGKGFVEFNPNKVAQETCGDTFRKWCARVAAYVKAVKLVRWDLAYDVPVYRSKLRLEKDRRHFRLEQGSAMTEYLGMRNTPGYVKLYDKAAELGMEDVALTRLELTCSGDWDLDEIEDHWPTVYSVRASCEGLSNTNSLLVGLLADKVRAGGTVEPELKTLNKHTRKKISAALKQVGDVEYPRAAVQAALGIANTWCDVFAK